MKIPYTGESGIMYPRDAMEASGPIPLHNFHKLCLQHPSYGFYSQGKCTIGREGSFITAPEISQCFGESIGVYMMNQWLKWGQNRPISLIELGPGKGTMMSDIVRTIGQFPWIKAKLKNVILVECNETLIQAQKQRLLGTPGVSWDRDFLGSFQPDRFKEDFTVIVANEFLDALPMYAFSQRENGLMEYLVDIDDEPSSQYHFKFCLSGRETSHANIYGSLFGLTSSAATLGCDYEVSPDALLYLKRSCDIIANGLGLAIFVDYGYEEQKRKLTLRGYHKHRMVPIFEKPGQSDLTYDINFDLLQRIVSAQPESSDLSFRLLSQRNFLLQSGIQLRLASLIKQNPLEKEALQNSVHRLLEDMGSLFKVFLVDSCQSRGK